jgi:methionyl aminopeptidase
MLVNKPEQIQILRKAGSISKKVIDSKIREFGAEAWFKEEKNYHHSSCLSVNDVWIHGIPGSGKLRIGDIISIDVGIKYKGMYVDHCWTVPVLKDEDEWREKDLYSSEESYSGALDPQIGLFLQTGIKALDLAIKEFKPNGRTGDISAKMQSVVEGGGYSVIRDFVGHGVGLKSHEDPEIPCFGSKGAGKLLKKGMVLAIEVMYAEGKPDIKIAEDGWTVLTKDSSLSGMYEHTVFLGENGPEILTQ